MKNIQELADKIVQLTEEYISIFFQSNPEIKSMDKQLLAALHIGFFAGLKEDRIVDDVVWNEALEMAQKRLVEIYPELEVTRP